MSGRLVGFRPTLACLLDLACHRLATQYVRYANMMSLCNQNQCRPTASLDLPDKERAQYIEKRASSAVYQFCMSVCIEIRGD